MACKTANETEPSGPFGGTRVLVLLRPFHGQRNRNVSRATLFEKRGESDWMSEHFFSGGMMPSDDLALRFQRDLALLHRWRWSGTHYARTANAWLANLDANRECALAVLAGVHGDVEASQWLQRWRMFFMACAELFGYDGGRQWFVSHYLFERPIAPAR